MPKRYHIQALTTEEAHNFCGQWLPAWNSELRAVHLDRRMRTTCPLSSEISSGRKIIRVASSLNRAPPERFCSIRQLELVASWNSAVEYCQPGP
jgi:hypothetical protein